MNTDILEPGSLRVTDKDSKDMKVFSEDGSCVKGSLIIKVVPPAAPSDLLLGLLKRRGKLRSKMIGTVIDANIEIACDD